jgi:hypothetical protein
LSEKITSCRICYSQNFVELINLGKHPPSNSFIHESQFKFEKKFPLLVLVCTTCGLAQLSEVVSQEEVFKTYAYRTSRSGALINSFKDLSQEIKTIVDSQQIKYPSIFEIGCNDGLSLEQFAGIGGDLVGVEPSNASSEAAKKGFTVVNEFFTKSLAKDLVLKYGEANIITVSNVLAHVPNMTDFIEGVKVLLANKGVWIVEFPYLFDMIESNLFDTIYHEHLSYLSIIPLELALVNSNLTIFDIKRANIGGSGPYLRVFIKHLDDTSHHKTISVSRYFEYENSLDIINIADKGYFAKSVSELIINIKDKVNEISLSGYSIGGFGAPAKGNTLINSLEIDRITIPFIADNAPEKIGLYTPGSHIPVISDFDFLQKKVDIALLLSWNYLDFFMKNSEYIFKGGRYLVPLPYPYLTEKRVI